MNGRTQELFCDIYEEQQRLVYAYFLSCFHDAYLAEELSQETFEKIWRYLSANPYFVPMQQSAWVFRVVANVKNDYLRRKRASPGQTELEPMENLLPDHGASMERRIQSVSILEAFQMLDEAERELLTYKGQGLTSVQMELIMAVPASTLRSRLTTAKKHLRRAMRQCGVDWEE